MAWVRAGTVAVTNGSAVVTGTGTAWANNNVQIGHAFIGPDRGIYEVASVDSPTQITLATPYLGATANGQPYSVQPNQGFSQAAATTLQGFLTQYGGYVLTSLAGRFGDGNVATPGIAFSADQGTGFYRLGAKTMGIACGGVNLATISPTGISVQGAISGNLFRSYDSVEVQGSGSFRLNQPGNGADAKFCRMYAGNTAGSANSGVYFDLVNDAFNSATGWLSVTRTGITPTGAYLNCGLAPFTDNVAGLGNASLRWSNLFIYNNPTVGSDARLKGPPKAFDDAFLDAWGDVSFVVFQKLEAIQREGADAARWHAGLIAQDLKAALSAHGIDAERYGMLCHDTWEAQDEVRQEYVPPIPAVPGVPDQIGDDGTVLTWKVEPKPGAAAVPASILQKARAAGDSYSVRYDQVSMAEHAWVRRELVRGAAARASLEARLATVEAKLAA